MSAIEFHPITPSDYPEGSSISSNVFQTQEWMQFLRKSQQVEPVYLRITRAADVVGYFSGGIVSKYGVRILGSPLAGWATAYMGFSGIEPDLAVELFPALQEYAFSQLRCMHIELMDRSISVQQADNLHVKYRTFKGYQVDLRPEPDVINSSFRNDCRWSIRKAIKSGVTIEEAHDDSFADDYYRQLVDVFAKQDLVPTYSMKRVETLIETLRHGEQLLLLRALDPEGACIATGIFLGGGDLMYFWGGASFRSHQNLRPNELLMWHAMMYWRDRGALFCDLGGSGEYKKKYRGEEIAVPWIRVSKYQSVEFLRNCAKHAAELKQRISGKIR